MLKLYYHPLSTFSQRVRIALLEKKISATLVEVDLFARAQFLPDYVAKNPYSRVPAIEEDGWVLYESTPILEYLEAMTPSPPLLPAAPRERARVAMHMKLCDLEFAGPARDILVPKRFLPKERWNSERMERAKERIGRHLSILESQVEGHEYLVGDRFTLADVCYAPLLQFLPLMEVTPGPATVAWAGRVLERPSVKETRPAK
ncbi:MAG TPA: glutathione S-transferase family protein [Candidatus Polarisedimenticolia bacterium]|nr:glutathione S-transferase family protein [Candidatus Polarisedimenticolia bacterium]